MQELFLVASESTKSSLVLRTEDDQQFFLEVTDELRTALTQSDPHPVAEPASSSELQYGSKDEQEPEEQLASSGDIDSFAFSDTPIGDSIMAASGFTETTNQEESTTDTTARTSREVDSFGMGEGRSALLGEMIVGTFFLLGTVPAMLLTESLGRRPVIIWCFAAMTVALGVLGLLQGGVALVITCFAVYALFSGGPGNLEWLYPNELFPTDIRATAMGVAMAFSRIGTVIAIYGLPAFISAYGTGPTMLVGAVISAAGLAVSIAWAPETKGVPLSQTGSPDFSGR